MRCAAVHRELIYLALSSVAVLSLIPMQDILGFGNDCRMNKPGTTSGNWIWRCAPRYFSKEVSALAARGDTFFQQAGQRGQGWRGGRGRMKAPGHSRQSPRKGGNTEILAEQVVAGMKDGGAEVEVIRLADYTISPCIACGGCEKTGQCVVQDDMQELYPKIDSADRLVLVSPIYFYGVTAQLKAFIDRCQAQWSRKYLLRQRRQGRVPRIGYLVSAAATKGEKIFDGASLTAQYAPGCHGFRIRRGVAGQRGGPERGGQGKAGRTGTGQAIRPENSGN